MLADYLHARCLVLDSRDERVAIVIVDSLALPRDLLDEIKIVIKSNTGIPPDHVLISATHTHSAPAAMNALGTIPDPRYRKLLLERIPQGVSRALRNLAPARIGWTVIQDTERTHTRRWIRRPDATDFDPFGDPTVRANMDPGFLNPAAISPSGPSDPDISIVSVQSREGRPIALLATYSQHFYGAPTLADGRPIISADYFGLFAQKISGLIATNGAPPVGGFDSRAYSESEPESASAVGPSFVAMMAQGTSGDQAWKDFSKPAYAPGIDAYTQAIAQEVFDAYRHINYETDLPLRMAEARLTLAVEIPDEKRLKWARKVSAGLGDAAPRTIPQVYALEQLRLSEMPSTEEIKLQAIRLGDLGITALPIEAYAITGLKIKAQSPLRTTINIGLANGYNGYLPPPEQFGFGGYTTWPHTRRRLGTSTEPELVEATLRLLETVSGHSRAPVSDVNGPYAQAVLAAHPWAYWRLGEFNGPTARDSTGNGHEGQYEDRIAFYLPGPDSRAFSSTQINRAPYLAGGRIRRSLESARDHYSAEFWFWDGLPSEARAMTGWLFSTGTQSGLDFELGVGGPNGNEGKLMFRRQGLQLVGPSNIASRTWNFVALVVDGKALRVYLNGNTTPELIGTIDVPSQPIDVCFGGRGNQSDPFDGKIDEVALYERSLSELEISDHYRLSAIGSSR